MVIWQKLIAFHLLTEKAFWWNFHYCVDTTSNIPSQWAFYDLSSLLTYQAGSFRLRSIWKNLSVIHFNTKISCVLRKRLVKMTDFLLFQSWFLLIFQHSFAWNSRNLSDRIDARQLFSGRSKSKHSCLIGEQFWKLAQSSALRGILRYVNSKVKNPKNKHIFAVI